MISQQVYTLLFRAKILTTASAMPLARAYKVEQEKQKTTTFPL
ncbi:hypothetical protein J2X31_003286 [Flavobacterium arsenatis]|uniref:Uncharacterized protein n=1 Tax=Flavobacterium arsenatis TaxID=1484332 RepID=A0ABU1TTP2_9FLAO|nr:hypothetical protein [Flavobacterium arsenatis]MDR6969259.1 hypothetical protein [Flavobacterium arsenatis]